MAMATPLGIELRLERKTVRGVLRVRVYRWIERGLAKPGKSAKGLAVALGCSESAVSRLRSGRRRIQLADVPTIEAYLGERVPGQLTNGNGTRSTNFPARTRKARAPELKFSGGPISTLDDAIAAYRGQDQFCKAFGISAGTMERWRYVGVPHVCARTLPRPPCVGLRHSPSALRQ